ncbi:MULTISPECIES: fibronectin type III domain-containing protein [unclassified Leucobacter]
MAAKSSGSIIGHYGVFLSEDSGLTFVQRPNMGGTDVVAATLSGDGRTLMVARTTGSGASAVSKVYVSKAVTFHELGTADSLVNAAGFAATGSLGSWLSVASSYDGRRLVVGGYHEHGSVWSSENQGESWQEQPSEAGTAASNTVAITAAGWQIYAGNGLNGGKVIRSVAPPGGAGITHYQIQYTRMDPSDPGYDPDVVTSDPLTGWVNWTPGTPITGSPGVVGNLINTKDYWFRVAAANSYGNGPWGGPVKATPMGTPDAPQQLRATADNGEVALTWEEPVSDGGFPIVDYKIEYRLASGSGAPGSGGWVPVVRGTSTALTYTVTGLQNGQWYEFRVAAVNESPDPLETRDGQGPWNDPFSEGHATSADEQAAYAATFAKPLTAPTAPRITQSDADVIPDDTTVTLNWLAPIDNGGSDLKNYTVEMCRVPAGPAPTYTDCADPAAVWTTVPVDPADVLLTTIEASGLTNGVKHWFRITATNEDDLTSPFSLVVTATPRGPAFISIGVSGIGDGMDVNVTEGNRLSSAKQTVQVRTNSPAGYSLTVSTETEERALVNEEMPGALLMSGTGTTLSPTTLDAGSWGFRVDNLGGFGASTAVEQNVSGGGQHLWAGVPGPTAPATIRNSSTGTCAQAVLDPDHCTADNLEIWYAMRVSPGTPPGRYEQTIVYTAVAN